MSLFQRITFNRFYRILYAHNINVIARGDGKISQNYFDEIGKAQRKKKN
jgi:hypothetical protein